MSRPRHRWWGYAKNCVRDYPALRAAAEHARKPENRLRPEDRRELRAVEAAAAETAALPDGPLRMELIERVYWKKTHSLQGAAMRVNVSYATAKRWHRQFITAVGRRLRLM